MPEQLREAVRRRGLRAVEDDESPVLLVSLGIFVVGRMFADEIHESQRMVGIGNGPGITVQSQPADAAMIVLDELPVGLLALLLAERKLMARALGHARLLA